MSIVKSRNVTLAIGSFAILTSAVFASTAPQPITLANMKTVAAKSGLLTTTGSCGGAPVSITGYPKPAPGSEVFIAYDDDFHSAKVIVAGLTLTTDKGLQDGVQVSCLTTKAGERLVVSTSCSGSACGALSYFIIDPMKGKQLAPKACNKRCATKILGRSLD